jgi:hypothetical protein
MRKQTLALIGALIITTSCTGDILNGGDGSGGDFAISVSGGTQPTYSWTAGPAFEVSVARAADQTVVVWRVADVVNRNIRSPVRQGVVPQGATETAASERILTAGVTYRVSIRLADGSSAFQEFRP